LVNTDTTPDLDAQTTAAKTLETQFLLYLVEGSNMRLVVPKDLHQTFLQLADGRNNQTGIDCTYQRLRTNYFINGMAKVVKEYVSHCPACLLNRPPKFKPTGSLHPIRPAASRWNLVTINFVVKMLLSMPSRGMKN
jgi:hypothetical protein